MNSYLNHRLNPKHDGIKILTTTKMHDISIHFSYDIRNIPNDLHLFNILNSQPFYERRYRDKNNIPVNKKYQKKIIKIDISTKHRLISSGNNVLPVEKFCSRLKTIHIFKNFSISMQPFIVNIVATSLLLNSLTSCSLKWLLLGNTIFDQMKRNSNPLLKGLAKQTRLENLDLQIKPIYSETLTDLFLLIPRFQQLRSLSVSCGGFFLKEFIYILIKTVTLANSLCKLKMEISNFGDSDFYVLIVLFLAISKSNIKHLYCNMSDMTLDLKLWQNIALAVEKCIQLENLNLLIGKINKQPCIIENPINNTISKCYSKTVYHLQNLKELAINWDIFTYFSCSEDYVLPNLEKLVFNGFHLDLGKHINNYESIVKMMPKLKQLDLDISHTKFEKKGKLYLINTIFKSLYRLKKPDNLPELSLKNEPYGYPDGVDKMMLAITNIMIKNKTILFFKSLEIRLSVADAPKLANFLGNFKHLEKLCITLYNWRHDKEFDPEQLGDWLILKSLKHIEIDFNGIEFTPKTDKVVLKLLKYCMNLKTLNINFCQFGRQLQDNNNYIFFDMLSEILIRNPLEELTLRFAYDTIWSKTTISHFIKAINKVKTLKTLSLPNFGLDGTKKDVLTMFISQQWKILYDAN